MELKEKEQRVNEEMKRLDELDDDDIEQLREKRRREMMKYQQKKQKWLADGHGRYREIADQKQFFAEVKAAERAVVHFYRGATWRCQIVDRHLDDLAKSHVETKFIKVDAEKCPFLVEKLQVWMLPTMVLVSAQR